jgi:uncharacterized protein (TIGR00375 family)
MRLEAPNFRELMLAFKREGGRGVEAHFGMDPRLGRYHRSYCHGCEQALEGPPPVLECAQCREPKDFVRGVLDRVAEIGDYPEARSPAHRPPYHYQVPLNFVPGLGQRNLDHLIGYFGSEMAVLHRAPKEQLVGLVGWDLASQIVLARQGELRLVAGGGGVYGKVEGVRAKSEQLSLF